MFILVSGQEKQMVWLLFSKERPEVGSPRLWFWWVCREAPAASQCWV